jgi:hypothetical protein
MSDTASFRSFVRALHERKVWSTAVAYLVVGFGLVEASDVVFPHLQFPPKAVDVFLAALLFCFPLALAASWRFRGENRATASSPAFPVLSLVIVTALFGWLGLRALPSAEEPGTTAQRSDASLPLVIMMDSPHPARVYDEETLAANGTNADVISDILLDLPIRRQRESIGPDWHRDEEILQFDPALVVIHYSGFRQERSEGPRRRLKLLISFFVESQTRFLIYSRAEEAVLRSRVDQLLGDLEGEHPGLLARVSVFGLLDHGPPSWRSPLTANAMKLRVKEILGI